MTTEGTTQKPQRIIRAAHNRENPYFQVARATAQDVNLSFEARGVLMYILSKPDHWQVQIGDLKKQGMGRDKAYRVLGELRSAGYIEITQERIGGKFGSQTWVVHETPFTEKPDTVEPDTAKPQLDNTEKEESKEKESSLPVAEKVKAPRKRNEAADAVTTHFFEIELGVNPELERRAAIIAAWMTGGKAPKSLGVASLEKGLTPDEIAQVARFFRAKNPDASSMPQSIPKIARWVWDYIAAGKPMNGRLSQDAPAEPMITMADMLAEG